VQREADLASFLGQKDAVAFCALADGQIASVLSGVIDQTTVRLVHVLFEAGSRERARLLLSCLEAFAREANARVVFAQVVRDSHAHRALLENNYTQDFTETDVVAGRMVSTVDLTKIL